MAKRQLRCDTVVMRTIMRILAAVAVGTFLTFAAAAQPAKTDKKPASTDQKSSKATTKAPTAQEIADAKAKGLVWVNTSTKVYHKDGEFYGTTKQGKFMTEADAQKAGFRAAKEPTKKTTSKTTSTKTDSKK